MKVWVGEVAPGTARQVPARVRTDLPGDGGPRGPLGLRGQRDLRAAVTDRSAGLRVTFGEVDRSSRVTFAPAGSDTKTTAPPGSTAMAALANCLWFPGSTTEGVQPDPHRAGLGVHP